MCQTILLPRASYGMLLLSFFLVVFSGICPCGHGDATAATPEVCLVSVVSDPCDDHWNIQKTSQMETALAVDNSTDTSSSAEAETRMVVKSVTGCSRQTLAADLEDARKEGYSYHYHLEKKPDGTIQLTLENWSKQTNKAFGEFQWTIDPEIEGLSQRNPQEEGPKIQPVSDYQDSVLESLLQQSKAYLKNQNRNQRPQVAAGAGGANPDKTSAPGHSSKGNTEAKSGSGQVVSPYSNDGPREKHYLRASSEIFAYLAIGSTQYYLIGKFKSDYDFDASLATLKKRFITGEAILFDNNKWGTNALTGHVPVGTTYYWLPRSNGLNIYESMAITMGTSTVWEFLVEMREIVSLNDLILTPFSGIALGEATYQLGEFFQHSSPNLTNLALGALFGFPAAAHHWLDNNWPKPPTNVDSFGFTTDVWHRFRLYAGGGVSVASNTDTSRGISEVGIDLELVNIEKYGNPGEVSTIYSDGAFNDVAFRAVLGDGEILDSILFAKAAFLGHYQQFIVKDESTGQLNGHSLFLGIGTAFEHLTHDFAGPGNEDKFAVCDLVGPSLVADFYHQGLHIRAGMDVYSNFAMVQPFSVDLFKEHHSVIGSKNIFEDEGYYYALGLTAAGRLEADYGPFGLEGHIRYYYFDSIEGLNRQPERVVNDFNMKDERLWMQLALSYALIPNNLKIVFDMERLYRWSEIKDFNADREETRFVGKLMFEF
jgi:hypothetical protein